MKSLQLFTPALYFSLHLPFSYHMAAMLSCEDAYLSNNGVEKQEPKKGEKHNGAMETQHWIGDQMVHSWEGNCEWQLPHHLCKVVSRQPICTR